MTTNHFFNKLTNILRSKKLPSKPGAFCYLNSNEGNQDMKITRIGALLLLPVLASWFFIFPNLCSGTNFQNQDCLKCHATPKLSMANRFGKLTALTIDTLGFKATLHGRYFQCTDCHIQADTTAHPNTGYPDVDCMACHSDLPDLYPPNAKETLRLKNIKIPPEKMVGEKYLRSKHGIALLLNRQPDAPRCYDCHTMHNVKPQTDPAASIHPNNLPETCLACHPEGDVPTGLINQLTAFKIKGHRKENLSENFSASNCQGCHLESASHQDTTDQTATCAECHRPAPKEAALFFTPFHDYPTGSQSPIERFIRIIYIIFIALVITAAFVMISIILFKKYQINDEVIAKLLPPQDIHG